MTSVYVLHKAYASFEWDPHLKRRIFVQMLMNQA